MKAFGEWRISCPPDPHPPITVSLGKTRHNSSSLVHDWSKRGFSSFMAFLKHCDIYVLWGLEFPPPASQRRCFTRLSYSPDVLEGLVSERTGDGNAKPTLAQRFRRYICLNMWD